MLTVSEATREDFDSVNRYLSTAEPAFAYHYPEWLEAVKSAYGYEYHYLMARENEALVGVLPICAFVNFAGKTRYCSLPFCDIGGVVANDEPPGRRLLREALARLGGKSACRLEIRRLSRASDVATNMAGRKVSMLLDLPEDYSALREAFGSKLRSQVRKAEKNGLVFDCDNSPAAVDDFFEVYARNMHALGSPCHSNQWFQCLRGAYGDKLLIGRVRHRGLCIGAGVLLFGGVRASVPWASTLREFNRLAPNMLLYANLLRIACERGCASFDFGRSTHASGTFRFKRQWGARPVPLTWEFLDQAGRATRLDAGRPGRLRRIAESIWRTTPLAVANRIGPLLRKHISL